MTAPNIAAITASLERSLQSFSLNYHTTTTTDSHCPRSSDATLDLNSNMTLPYHWEQCLDLKTGEMYYINWRTGMKSKEDPWTVDDDYSGYYYSDDESSNGDSESSSVESSPGASSSEKQKQNDEEDEGESRVGGHVLVVAGCKGCFMYFMVPKQVEDCPKCCGQLLHFDRSDDN
ncbi:putative WW domain superfamily protein [Helianthus debilis subsp. tardiflorus]